MLYWPKASFGFFKYFTHLQDSVKTFSPNGRSCFCKAVSEKTDFTKSLCLRRSYFFFFFNKLPHFSSFACWKVIFLPANMNCITSTPFTLLFFRREELARAGTLLGADYAQKECAELGDERPCVTERLQVGSGASASQVVQTGARSWDPWRIRK